jgi:agmatine deiminase
LDHACSDPPRSVKRRTPAALGFRLPAEWEPHEATWIAWPHNRSDWPGKFAAVPWAFAELVRYLVRGELVRILVSSQRHQASAGRVLGRVGVDLGRIQFLRFPTNRGWTRDFGPIFLRREDPPEIAIVRFRFNAWAKYSDWKLDNRIPALAARRLKLRLFKAELPGRWLVLEGGAVEGNGRGTLITTEECLLDAKVQVRNPGLSRGDLEGALRDYLGAGNVCWLNHGIAGDDTHGHVDDVCRFVGPRTMVLCRETNPRDPNYGPLEENRERLQDARLEDGSKPEVVDLPMPAPLVFRGQRLPASYANFYIGNAATLVPTFNDPNDRLALGILGELLFDRPVVGIHAVDLVWGLGTLHCLTQQQPSVGQARADQSGATSIPA